MDNICSEKIIFLYWLLLCQYYLIKRTRKHKRWINSKWHTRPINKLRQLFGHYENLFQELKNDESMFFRYTRMSKQSFETLLEQSHLKKQSHRALPPEQRLLIALR